MDLWCNCVHFLPRFLNWPRPEKTSSWRLQGEKDFTICQLGIHWRSVHISITITWLIFGHFLTPTPPPHKITWFSPHFWKNPEITVYTVYFSADYPLPQANYVVCVRSLTRYFSVKNNYYLTCERPPYLVGCTKLNFLLSPSFDTVSEILFNSSTLRRNLLYGTSFSLTRVIMNRSIISTMQFFIHQKQWLIGWSVCCFLKGLHNIPEFYVF